MKKLFLLLLLCCFSLVNAKTINKEIFAKTFTIEKVSTPSVEESFQQRKKTVHVKSYKRKNGTVVKAHKRRAPRKH